MFALPRLTFSATACPLLSHGLGYESGQIRLAGAAAHSRRVRCCPTESQDAVRIEAAPEHALQNGEKSGERAFPFRHMRDEAQQHVGEQGRPHLPADCVFAVDEEVVQLQRLLELVIEGHDFAVTDVGAQLGRFGRVVGACGLHDGEPGQERMQVKTHVTFVGGLSTTMLRPVHTVGDKLYGGRVHSVDHDALEAAGKPRVFAPLSEVRTPRLQRCERLPEQLFGHVGVSHHVRMRKTVSTRRGGPPQRGEAARMVAHRVARVVKAQGMGKLSEDKRHGVTHGREAAGFLGHFVLFRQLWSQISRNLFDNLPQDGRLATGRLNVGTPVLIILRLP